MFSRLSLRSPRGKPFALSEAVGAERCTQRAPTHKPAISMVRITRDVTHGRILSTLCWPLLPWHYFMWKCGATWPISAPEVKQVRQRDGPSHVRAKCAEGRVKRGLLLGVGSRAKSRSMT